MQGQAVLSGLHLPRRGELWLGYSSDSDSDLRGQVERRGSTEQRERAVFVYALRALVLNPHGRARGGGTMERRAYGGVRGGPYGMAAPVVVCLCCRRCRRCRRRRGGDGERGEGREERAGGMAL